jgi:SAM-dependent methyltransferase
MINNSEIDGLSSYITECVNNIIEQYNLYFQRKLGSVPDVYKKSNEDHYCFIPSRNIAEIIDILYKVKRQLHTPPIKFLDCGCGIGNIMLIAEAVGYEAYGIEYEKVTCKIAKDLTWKLRAVRGNRKNGSIIHGDITTFEYYADYDVIYYYTPIKDFTKRKQFREKLANDVKVGGVVISYGGSNYFRNDVRFKIFPKTYWAYRKIAK